MQEEWKLTLMRRKLIYLALLKPGGMLCMIALLKSHVITCSVRIEWLKEMYRGVGGTGGKDTITIFRVTDRSEVWDLECIRISVLSTKSPRQPTGEGLLQTTNSNQRTRKLLFNHLFKVCGEKNCVVVWDFNLGCIYWRLHTTSSETLECLKILDDNFLIQNVLHEVTILDLIMIGKDELNRPYNSQEGQTEYCSNQ